MKQFLLFLSLASGMIFSVSCQKSNDAVKADTSTAIVGNWEIRRITAAGNSNIYNYPSGNGTMLKFKNGRYDAYTNGQFTKSGFYSIIADTNASLNVGLVLPKEQFTHRIVYDGNYDDWKQYVQLSNNKLTIITGSYINDSGQTSVFEKTASDNSTTLQ